MFNDPRAKDLLAQYPRQLAEGGAVDQPFQAPAVAPRGRPTLTPVAPVENTLSMSQQFARDRAAQDAMIRDAISKTGAANPATMNYHQLRQAVRAGDITGENIKQKFVDPELEARVRNAYAAIGRTGGVVPTLEMPKKGGATADTYKQVRQDEYNYWADQLKQGKISPTDFQNAFLKKAATDIPTTDLEAQRAYVNSARKALGMADLELPKKKYTGPFIGFTSYKTSNNNAVGMASIGPKIKPKVPKLPTQPIDLSGTASTPVQLFDEGGEAVAGRDPRSMDLEQFLLENSRTQVGPVDVQEVRSSRGPGKYDTRISKDEGGFQAFADVDVGDKKLSQVGASFVGRGRIGNYEVQYVFDPETKQPVITGAIRKELSPTSDVSAEGVYVPQKDGKDYYNAGVRYTKRFDKGGEVEKTGKFEAEVLANARLSPDYYVQPEPDLIIERASSKGLKDFDRRIAEQSKGTNAAVDPSRYIRKDSTIFPFENKLNVLGWVQSNKPDQIQAKTAVDPEYAAFLSRLEAADPKMQSAFDRMLKKREFDTVVHEMTHANQIKEAFASDKDYERAARLAKRYSKAMELQNYMDKEEYLNPMSGSGLKERELGAYLNSYEGIHPSAKTVSGKQALIPFEKTYLGNQVLPPAKGLDKLLEEIGAFGAFSDLRDPETLKYVNKMMGREKRKPTAAAKTKK